MLLRRLFIEFDHDQRWVTFRKEGAGDKLSGFRLDDAFDTGDVVAAACATGSVVQRDGQCWVVESMDCDALSDCVHEMLFYFLRSGEPRDELVRIRDQIKSYLTDAEGERPPLSLWACAYLDLTVREDIADEARDADDLWGKPVLELRVDQHCRKHVEQLAARCVNISKAAQDVAGSGKMAPSQRTRAPKRGEKEVG